MSRTSSSAVPDIAIIDIGDLRHRFPRVVYNEEAWDLSHLAPFAFRTNPGLGFDIDVVVLFSCHCFSHSLRRDGRAEQLIPLEEIYNDGRERRVLSESRYRLSRRFLPALVRELPNRRIQVATDARQNFMTMEVPEEHTGYYVVFFMVERDKHRRKRMLLRVQSAYLLESLTDRQRKAGKVNFSTLLKAAYENRKIRG
jgi:hypothetical protein